VWWRPRAAARGGRSPPRSAQELLEPGFENRHLVNAVLPEAGSDVVRTLLCSEHSRSFRIEQVGEADDLFFKGDRYHVPFGEGELLLHNILDPYSDTDMTLTYEGMGWEAFRFQDLSSQDAVTDVGRCAVAADSGRVCPRYADVVEKRCLLHETQVYRAG